MHNSQSAPNQPRPPPCVPLLLGVAFDLNLASAEDVHSHFHMEALNTLMEGPLPLRSLLSSEPFSLGTLWAYGEHPSPEFLTTGGAAHS